MSAVSSPDSPSQSLIQLNDIVKTFKTTAGDVTVLKHINLEFGRGEFVGIVGKSGCGKSTLVNMITGIDHPTSGSVQVGDIQLHKMREGQLAVWRGRNMGVVFQFFQLLPMLTVLENTLLPMDLAGAVPAAERESRGMELLRLVGLEELSNKLPAALSGGQQQSAAIARSLANDPPIIVADEPTGNLDSATAESVFAFFRHLVKQGKTIIMVTHDNTLAAMTGRMVILSDGEVVNPQLAAALPFLSHPQMLQLTHLAAAGRLAEGEALQTRPGLVVVTGGQAEVTWNGRDSETQPQQKLAAGQYLSALETVESGAAGFDLRAVGGPLEFLQVAAADFEHWLAGAPQVESSLRQAARQRDKDGAPGRQT
jgi:ABC-type lipoprotein export system ATPase subunit